MKVTKNCSRIGILTLLFVLGVSLSFAYGKVSYDPYVASYPEGAVLESPPNAKKALSKFLVFPFTILRWPTDKALVYIEKNHIEKKALYIYDKIQEQGFSPRANIVSLSNFGAGVETDLVRIARLKEQFPDAIAKSWIHWTNGVYFKVGGELGLERIGGTGMRTLHHLQYENRPEEHFYGIGPDTSAGDGTVFSQETTTLKSSVGYSTSPVFSTDAFFSFRNVNISSGRDGGRGQRGEHPTFRSETPGFFGDSIASVGVEMVHDTRNQKDNSTRGGKRRLSLSYNEGLNNSEARYASYEAELSQYFRLGSDRRVLAFHFLGERRDEIGNGNVPFHQMSRLGGYGRGSRLSHTMRGFGFNRFFDESALLFNVEYRYTIWEYREFKVDSVFFWDEGQAFGEFSDFEFKDFNESYGIGFRLSLANVSLLSLEAAHSDEGTNFFVKTRTPF